MKHIGSHFLFLVMLFAASGLMAQDGTDIVYLKDGSQIKGDIIEDTDYAVTIVMSFGDTLTLGYKYISSVNERPSTLYEEDPKGRRLRVKSPKYHKEEGIFVMAELGAVFAGDDGDSDGIASIQAGKRVMDGRVYVGAGLAYRAYSDVINSYFLTSDLMPLYAYGRYNVYTNMSRLYISGHAGYSVTLPNDNFFWQGTHDYDGGLYGRLGFGLILAGRKQIRPLFELSIGYQQMSGVLMGQTWDSNLPFTTEYTATYIRPALSIGIEF